MKHEVNRLMKT